MVAVTYGVSRVATPADSKTAKPGRGFFRRVIDAIAASQLQRAEREIARHRHLLPHDFEFNGDLRFARKEKLPFGGW